MHQIYFIDNSIVDLERPVERLVVLRVSFGDPVGQEDPAGLITMFVF